VRHFSPSYVDVSFSFFCAAARIFDNLKMVGSFIGWLKRLGKKPNACIHYVQSESGHCLNRQ
jgi:hypothetical protein